MPVREAAAVTVDYSKFTIRQLKSMARGTGIKSWEKLRKAELIAALSAI
jgi:ABC-type proline/glycine betaine transport system permease subunit